MGEYLEFEESGTKITVEIGSAWHFNETIRNINTHLRGTKLPGSNWRVQDKGHFHLWKRYIDSKVRETNFNQAWRVIRAMQIDNISDEQVVIVRMSCYLQNVLLS